MPWRNAAGRDLLKDIECYICGDIDAARAEA
jgi:hypothetical protein